ncbi:MAG: hypothetical protein HRT61_19345 [Ekhidna sp.]|nr:hypothetical protein [Ekhidna sp.]
MKVVTLCLFAFLPHILFSQEERLDEKIDEVTYDWDLEADKLSTYVGLLQICSDTEYRSKVLHLLNEIHHYDTVLYEVLVNLSKKSDEKEIKKTLRDIKKFEEEYDTKSFIHFMNEECHAMREIEKDADVTVNDVGINSYSGQVYLLETELFKYVKNITSRVDKIRQHVHHLSKHYN